MNWFTTLLASLAAPTARDEGDDDRATTKAAAYTGPRRRRSDAIEVEARVVEDAPACSQDCSQGRACTCRPAITLEAQP